MKVLIVDDHAEVRKLIREMVTRLASEILECSDGEEAVRAFHGFVPDLVIMDLQMPVMDGIEATRRIVEKFPAARIIAISHSKHPGLRVSASRAGAQWFVQKDELSELPRYLAGDAQVS